MTEIDISSLKQFEMTKMTYSCIALRRTLNVVLVTLLNIFTYVIYVASRASSSQKEVKSNFFLDLTSFNQ